MKKLAVIGIGVIIGSFVALSFINKSEAKKECLAIRNSSSKYVALNIPLENKPEVTLNYFVRGAGNRTITKSKLSKAKTLEDIVEHFPSNWIGEYILVETYRITKNSEIKILGKDVTLNKKQRSLFKDTNVGDDVLVRVVYKSKNSLTNSTNTNETNILLTVVPEVSASFISDKNTLKEYLTKNSSKEIVEWQFKPMQNATAYFIVNEEGKVAEVNITKSTGVTSVDASIMELLYGMPRWSPAKNTEGKKIKQQFELVIGDDGC
ncbi:energy transducer TonB [Tenacibaculum ovolyticum]|uniref:energy transducer TonB n=1 Tax=Tenacibaculum ovolyticum TaxID=104270 RepID=UPI003BADBC52